MSRSDTRTPVLNNIYKIGFASPSNFIPFLSKSEDFKAAKNWPDKIFKAFIEKGLIKEVKVYNRIYTRQTLRDTFYCLTQAGYDALEVKARHYDPKSINQINHESGLNDILLGFIYAYPDCEVTIDRNFVFKNEKYKPDALVKVFNPNTGRLDNFIVEFERTRTWEQIRKEKFGVALKVSPKDYGLECCKFLYIYAHEQFNVFKRPMEWTPSILEFQNRHFKKFKDYTQGLKNNFLFARYHDFTRLNESVWHSIDGTPRKLIQ